jgi:hypothetical protein
MSISTAISSYLLYITMERRERIIAQRRAQEEKPLLAHGNNGHTCHLKHMNSDMWLLVFDFLWSEEIAVCAQIDHQTAAHLQDIPIVIATRFVV